ncbi:MAG: dTMP kinase [Armatimonadetes bacterium]|nr:dTMP kinase [Armatimonadota bacterium]MDW8027761.1 dTMP kinase [Armatimonadota bacterium]
MGGLFITIEGVEGSGKTTIANILAQWLQEKGLKVNLTSEPGSTFLGSQIREILTKGSERTAWAEAFLFLADRAEHVTKVIKPALERGEIVVCDRYSDSTIAYQAFGLGLNLEQIFELNQIATNGLSPDLTLLLDVPPEIGLARVQKKTVFEERELHFHQRVRWGYLWLAQREPERIKVLDASLNLEIVIAKAKKLVEEALSRWL